ncbi:MAG: ASCH domain-containing protein [Candidatus Izemoplasmatales bacterium]
MKSNILISIHPEYVDKIINGKKKYEFRTKVAKRDIDRLIIYSTYPTKKIIAEAKVIGIVFDSPDNLWKKTKDFAGVDKEYFDLYFKNRNIAYAYELGEIKVYETPKELNDLGFQYAPQSFVYL